MMSLARKTEAALDYVPQEDDSQQSEQVLQHIW